MKYISLTQGFQAIVDDEDFELLSKYKWCAGKYGNKYYALTTLKNTEGKYKNIYMHRFLNEPMKTTSVIDHKNGNGLDNRRNNLRITTQTFNRANSARRKDCTSIYKGVGWHKLHKKWRAQITAFGKRIHLGLFIQEQEAAIAYNKSAIQYYGEFAYINKLT